MRWRSCTSDYESELTIAPSDTQGSWRTDSAARTLFATNAAGVNAADVLRTILDEIKYQSSSRTRRQKGIGRGPGPQGAVYAESNL